MNCLRVSDVAEKLQVSVATVWSWSKEGKFPKPIKLGAGVTRWSEQDINDWIEVQANRSMIN